MAETYIIIVIVMHLIMIGMYSEKCVIRQVCCANIVEYASTILGDIVYNYNFMFYTFMGIAAGLFTPASYQTHEYSVIL